ncbi:MAG TPA: hypothetical protein VFH13_05340 [Gemmatimonadaceae bacterium]|nr:hypothetical protein [Gemmatimonadaceae bacterium]
MDIPKKPSDRYARARRLLHATAFLLGIGGFWWMPWPWWGIMIGVCEIVAFALLPRRVEDEPSDSVDAGIRIGCGAIAGFVAGIWWTWYHYFGKNAGAIYIASALVGAVVFAALAFRFGDKFWNWHNPF